MAAIHPPPKGPSAGVFWQKSHNQAIAGIKLIVYETDVEAIKTLLAE